MPIRSIAVFCGSSLGFHEIYALEAKRLGKKLAKSRIELVYGGANVGIMGAIADSVLDSGGKVTGVIPTFLQSKEIAHERISNLISVETMHERKMKMHELSDAVIALSGGFGTMEEIFEMLTWAQLGLHKKPIGILNTHHFYDHLLLQINTMVSEGFLSETHRNMVLISDDIEDLLIKLDEYQPPELPKWMKNENT